MDAVPRSRRGRIRPREIRLLIYLTILLAVLAWRFLPRPWRPGFIIETPHYVIASTATRAQAEEIGRTVEGVFLVYSNLLRDLPGFQSPQPKLQLRLYRDRKEFRRIHPGAGWAEAFYRRPVCHAYYGSDEINSHHWMLHEVVHQLNAEVAHLRLDQWLDEGLAEYFSTSRLRGNSPVLGWVDPNTYPVWWIEQMATTGDLASDLGNGSVIPLRAILSGRGGPNMDRHFNLYYLHWWSLTHFLFENAKHRSACLDLVRESGRLEAFHKLVGPVDDVQREWYAHVRHLKATLSGADLNRRKDRRTSAVVRTNTSSRQ
jgi:hypothetical protein